MLNHCKLPPACCKLPVTCCKLFLFILLVAPLALSAQQFGGNPSSLKWDQINTDTVRIIFPRGMVKEGQRVANIVQYLNHYTRSSIGNRQQKMSIVLQNQTLESNGYVQLGPFRSEFYLTPPPSSFDLGGLNWVDQLSLHEYRHALQNMNFRQGISKVFYYLGGELGQAAITNIAVPNWFWEGDAVVMETALSAEGRGRLPAFFDGFRGLTLSDKRYTYMKIRNGSYVDYIPNHYPLGYLMATYGREHYGQTFWKEVTTDAVRFRGLFYPFSHSLKKRTGKNVTGFYRAMLSEYAPIWKAYASRKDTTAAVPVGAPVKTVTNYNYVYPAGNNNWIVLKNSYRRIPGIYLLDSTGKETLLVRPGINFDNFFSYKNGKVVWAEARYDARWTWKDYTVIKMYDLSTGHTRKITPRNRYFSPDIAHNGQQLVATVTSPSLEYRLHVIDAQTGHLQKILPNPDNWYYTYPRFTADDQYVISAVRNQQGQMALVQQSITTGESTVLIPFSQTAYGAPVVSKDTLYFTAAIKDVNDVYAFTLSDKQLYQVTSRGNSALHVAVDPAINRLLFSEFSADGYTLRSTALNKDAWRGIVIGENQHSKWLRPDFKEGGDILGKIPAHTYAVKKYPKAYRLFNFHSWVPTLNDPEYSFTVYADNILNTAATNIGYTYNRNEGSSALSANFLYGAWFPYLSAGTEYTFNRSGLTNKGRVYWNELNWNAGFTIPLQLSSGLYGRSLSISSKYYYAITYPQSNFKFKDEGIQYISSSIVFNNQRIKARQHLFSHFGQTLQFKYTKSISAAPATQYYGRMDLYLPGLHTNHSLVLQGAWQQKDTLQRYLFSDNFSYARGYNTPFYEHIYKVGANYHFPIAYPDWGFAQLLYFMRVRGNLFYDYSMAYDFRSKASTRYASTGGELFFDTKIGNTIPFTFGMRFSHLLDKDPSDNTQNRVDFIIPLQQLFSY
ncbi:TolB family protein [Chitinophaga defluvii]|uniref:Uncharacterized protein n=1 Tax=Chitinophaga defluvii TaxID=3163343 RepID=A0ABV2SZI6_9BACT